jgi:hypothetical protein
MNKLTYIAYGTMWISVSIAVIYGIAVTKDATPLWAFLIPTFVDFPSK